MQNRRGFVPKESHECKWCDYVAYCPLKTAEPSALRTMSAAAEAVPPMRTASAQYWEVERAWLVRVQMLPDRTEASIQERVPLALEARTWLAEVASAEGRV